MDEIIKRNPSGLMNPRPRIENTVINLAEGDVPYYVKPIVMKDGKIVLLTTINGGVGHKRIVIQELTGEEIKTLLSPGYCNAYCTADEDNIYIFTSHMEESRFIVYDAETFELKKDVGIGLSMIQSVCCDGKHIFTYDSKNKEIQVRDKDGNIRQVKEVPPSHHFLINDSNGLHPIRISDIRVSDDRKEDLKKRFGKELVDSNSSYKSITFDEETQTLYVASNRIVYVATPQGLKGVMYFQDKNVTQVAFDPITRSLVVSSHYHLESTPINPYDSEGFIEIIPADMIDQKIQESSEILELKHHKATLKQIGYDIADLADGNFEVMIYLSEQAKKMGIKIKPIIDDLKQSGVSPDEIKEEFESRKNPEITPMEIAGSVWKNIGLEEDTFSAEIDEPEGE